MPHAKDRVSDDSVPEPDSAEALEICLVDSGLLMGVVCVAAKVSTFSLETSLMVEPNGLSVGIVGVVPLEKESRPRVVFVDVQSFHRD